MNQYKCWGCSAVHTTDNVAAYCAECYGVRRRLEAGLRSDLVEAKKEIERLRDIICEHGYMCGRQL